MSAGRWGALSRLVVAAVLERPERHVEVEAADLVGPARELFSIIRRRHERGLAADAAALRGLEEVARLGPAFVADLGEEPFMQVQLERYVEELADFAARERLTRAIEVGADRQTLAAIVAAPTNGTGPTFRRLDLVAFLAEPPPEEDWLVDGFVEYGELVWLAGRGKVGKSILVAFLADACLRGTGQFLGRQVGAVDWVTVVDGENREKTVRRRVHLAGMKPEVAEKIDYFSVRGIDLGSPEALEVLRVLVDRPGRGIVILDSLVALHTADEDKAGEVRRFADKLKAVFEPMGVTAIGLAHENRAGNLRGSLDWRNSADRVLELTKKDDGTRELRNGDVRDGADDGPAAAFRFVVEDDQIGRRRLLLETAAAAASGRARTKAEQVADHVVLLLRGDPTLGKAKVARKLNYAPDHGTFKRAWDTASRALAEEGGQVGPA
jgi:hypothetical protein